MSLKVSYKNEDLIDEMDDCVKIMKTDGCRLQDDITIDYKSEDKVLTTKQIIENGTYNASDDNADGYSSVSVDVPDTAQALIARTITSAVIPEGVTSLVAQLFYLCHNLETVSIPSSLRAISDWCFEECSSLKNITFPNSLTSINTRAFRMSGLERVTLPDTITSLGVQCFQNCSSLVEFNFPNTLRIIPISCVGNATVLTSIKLPNGLTQIQNYAFSGCTNLQTIDCTNLTITNGSATAVLQNVNVFSDTPNAQFIFATQEIMQVYAAATNWSTYASRMTYVGA